MSRRTFSTRVKTNILKNYHRGLGAAIFILLSLILTAPAKAQSPSFAGRYSGEWVSSGAFGEEHTGTWTISITTDGGVTGTEYDKTTGQKGELSGFVDSDGYFDLFLKYEKTYKLKGTLTKRGNRLTGVLKQFSGNIVVSTTDITLTAQNKSTNGISNDDPTMQRGVVVKDCLDTILNMKGTLIITMKDGSKRIIDLSEAKKITVVP
jgi:hypothetical protein